MTQISRSLIALGLIGSGVAAALGTLRQARQKKAKEQHEAATSAWESEAGSAAGSTCAEEDVTYR